MFKRLLILSWLVLFSALAHAQSYPAKPVRMIVPWAAGGTSDIGARIFTQRLSEAWKNQVVIENRPGAGGTIGTAVAAKAAPDGYTLLWASYTEMFVGPHMYKDIAYQTLRDFTPVVYVATQPLVLVVPPSLSAKTTQELVALAKSKPGALNGSSAGNGSAMHLALVLFERQTGSRIQHVPYAGAPQAITANLSGDAHLQFASMTAALDMVKSGKLRALAVTSAKRSPALPEVPALAEAGVQNAEFAIWNAVFVPQGTPAEVITRVYNDVTRLLGTKDVQDALARLSMEVSPMTRAQLDALARNEWASMQKLVAEAGVKVQ
jgi:tripartite-type tricarboxylate transporter receptor subunit TctC